MTTSLTTFAPNSSSPSPSSSSLNLNPFLCRALNSVRTTTTPRTSISNSNHGVNKPQAAPFRRLQHSNVSLRVANEKAEASTDATSERSEADKIVDNMNFGELCNDFECMSSPSVESTARQLVRDILDLRQGNRALGSYAFSVKYKDPVRSFTGRDKYKRQLWATDALDKPTVSVQQMVMLSTSLLNIKWTLRGKPKSPIFSIGGDLILKVDSKFTLNQISGQVIEHEESWDPSQSSFIAQAYFWASRRLFAAVEAGRDVSDSIKDVSKRFKKENTNTEFYPDPSGDPNKFFQRDDGFQRDLYQIALFLAIVYFVVQYLRTTL